jgi:hypothetical protein
VPAAKKAIASDKMTLCILRISPSYFGSVAPPERGFKQAKLASTAKHPNAPFSTIPQSDFRESVKKYYSIFGEKIAGHHFESRVK